MSDEEHREPRAVPRGETPALRGRHPLRLALTGLDALEFFIYAAAAAAVVGFVLWLLAAAIWQTGSPWVQGVFLALLAAAVAILINDLRQWRFSMLSRLLVGLWALALALIVIAELFSGFG